MLARYTVTAAPGQGFKLELIGEVRADPLCVRPCSSASLLMEHYPAPEAAQALIGRGRQVARLNAPRIAGS